MMHWTTEWRDALCTVQDEGRRARRSRSCGHFADAHVAQGTLFSSLSSLRLLCRRSFQTLSIVETFKNSPLWLPSSYKLRSVWETPLGIYIYFYYKLATSHKYEILSGLNLILYFLIFFRYLSEQEQNI